MENAFIRTEWLKPMEDAFVKRRKKRNLPVFGVGVGIEDLQELIRCYIEPLCRYQDHVGNAGKTSCSAFDAINLFMGEGVDPNVQGGNQMLVLGDSGTGKTSLLRLLKLARDLGFRPVDYACAFIQIGNDSLERIAAISNPSETILLLDGLETPLVFRLPKEAEWTHACRVGNETTYGHGDNERVFSEYGWYSGNSGSQTRPVGGKRPNPWGFHDMHGNVWEWCFDRDPLFSMALLSDLKGEGFDEIRAVRGGSWSSLVYACRTANRNWYPPQEVSNNIGFRVALVARKN